MGEDLASIPKALADRGPDETRLIVDGQCQVVHTKLAIRGFGRSSQPGTSRSGDTQVVFVGEIYNSASLKSRTSLTVASDEEATILAEGFERFGSRFLDEIDGIFCMLVHFRSRETIWLARDSFGTKPLFFRSIGTDGVAFATDVGSLAWVADRPLEVDYLALLRSAGRHGVCDSLPFADVHEVPEGSYLEFSLGGGSRLRNWYRIEAKAGGDGRAPGRRTDAYRDALLDAITSQTATDQSCGLFLSGGLDSSAIAAVARERVTGYVLDHPSTRANGDFDAAVAVSRALGLASRTIRPSEDFEAVANDYLDVVRAAQSADVRTEWILKEPLYQAAKADGHRVLLSGQGSDEFNGGYTKLLTGSSREPFETYLEDEVQGVLQDQLWEASSIPRSLVDFLAPEASCSLFDLPEDLWLREVGRRRRMLSRYNLRMEDCLAARRGCENRVPFLARHAIAVLFETPRGDRAELFGDKMILREAMRGIVPEFVRVRDKVGFFHGDGSSAAFEYLMRVLDAGGRRSLASRCLDSDAMAPKGPFAKDAVSQLAVALRLAPGHPATEGLAWFVNVAILADLALSPVPVVEIPKGRLKVTVRPV